MKQFLFTGRVKVWRVASLSEGARICICSPRRDPTPPALIERFKRFPDTGTFLGNLIDNCNFVKTVHSGRFSHAK